MDDICGRDWFIDGGDYGDPGNTYEVHIIFTEVGLLAHTPFIPMRVKGSLVH